MTDQQRDESTIIHIERNVQQIQRVADYCHERGVNIRPLVPQVEQAIAATKPLREAAEKAGMRQHEREVIADALGKTLREGMR